MASDTAILEHLAARFRVRVLGGFEEYDDILESIPLEVSDELGRRDRTLEDELRRRTRAAIDEIQRAAGTWTEPTINDAIDLAFAELDSSGIIALQNAGYTMSEGWEDVAEEAHHRPGARGAVFYHGQDLERAVAGDGLYLAFGSLSEGSDEPALSVQIGKDVCSTLEKHGVATRWDGTVKTRIHVPPFEWRRRLRPLG